MKKIGIYPMTKSERGRRHYLRHKDKVIAANKRWALANPKKIRAIKSAWKKRNPEINRRYVKDYQKRNPEKVRYWKRMSYTKNPEAFKINAREYKHRKRSVSFIDCTSKIRLLRIERFCRWCCRKLNESNLSIDHVIPLSRGGTHVPDNLVACCRSCNRSKSNKLVHEWLPLMNWS
jgi:5-methylcytosine-specific restriction endonuclease McrA